MANGNQGEAGISTAPGASPELTGAVGGSITPLTQAQLEASRAQVEQQERAFESLGAAYRQGAAANFLQDAQLLAEGRGGVARGGARVRQSPASKREAIAQKMVAQQQLDKAEADFLEGEAKLAGQEAQYAKQIEDFPQKVVDEFMTQASELGDSRPKLAAVAQARIQNLDMSLPHERTAAILLMQAYMSATKNSGTELAPLSRFEALLNAGMSPAEIIDYMENNKSVPPEVPTDNTIPIPGPTPSGVGDLDPLA